MLKTVAIYFASVIMTVVLASIASTQLILADVQSFGVDVSFGDRLHATLHDLVGLSLPLLMLVGLSFLVAFTIAHLAHRFVGGSKIAWFMAAGFCAVPAALMGIKFFMGGTLLASARTSPGMFVIACCSLVGGWLFFYLGSKQGQAGEVDA